VYERTRWNALASVQDPLISMPLGDLERGWATWRGGCGRREGAESGLCNTDGRQARVFENFVGKDR
jgi:hypothetical protein